LQGSWPAFTLVTGATFLGLILTAGYTLRIIQKVLLGPANPRWYQLPEMSPREIGTVAPLMALMLLTGVWPAWIVGVFNPLITRWFG
jgi:NADH-quinone oxidoreductase subunit M